MAEELTESQIEELRGRLIAERAELKELLATTARGAAPVDIGEPIGRLSRVDALQQQSMAQATRRDCEVRLRQISAALAAIEREDYGFCRRCEEPIGYRRLSVRPESPYCVECQGRRESSGQN